MKSVLGGAALAVLLTTAPGLAAVLLGLLGTAAVAVASSPYAWAFCAGLAAWPPAARTARRWAR